MHVFLIAATSIDGFLADKTDQKSTSWTSKEDFQFFTSRTKAAGVVVMGSTTYATIGHPLKDRLTIVMTKHPEKITPVEGLLITSASPQEIISLVAQKGYQELAVCGGSSVYTQFMAAGLVKTIYLTMEPHVFGSGIPLFNQPLGIHLQLKSCQNLNPNTLLLEYSLPTDS